MPASGLNWFIPAGGFNRFKPGKIAFKPTSGINAFNFGRFKPWFKPGGLTHLPTLIQTANGHRYIEGVELGGDGNDNGTGGNGNAVMNAGHNPTVIGGVYNHHVMWRTNDRCLDVTTAETSPGLEAALEIGTRYISWVYRDIPNSAPFWAQWAGGIRCGIRRGIRRYKMDRRYSMIHVPSESSAASGRSESTPS